MATENAIVVRNRQNCLKSTGPKTAAGKAIASRNRLRHGLRANPASLDGEDGRQFRGLHGRLVAQVQPRDEIECGLVHRIAVSLWRLQRSARIDGALSSLSVREVAPLREEAQNWIERVHAAWNVEFVQETNPTLLRQRREEGLLGAEQMWVRPIRYGIRGLDRLREEMMRSGAGVTAMLVILDDLVDRMLQWPTLLHDDQAEKLAWLLGAPACSFWIVEPGHALEGEEARGSPILCIIHEGQQRQAGEKLPVRLQSRINSRRDTLRQQRELCSERYTARQEKLRETAALLPVEPTLDGLIRYEGHAERSLQRNIDLLAKLRGVAVESLSSRLMGRAPDGTVVAVEQRRTKRLTRGLGGNKLPNEARGGGTGDVRRARQVTSQVG